MDGRLEFGISITPEWSKQDELLDLARVADETGLDLIGIQDHLNGIAQAGMDAFIFWPGGDDPVQQAEAFASEVAPEVRAEAASS